MNRIEIKGIIPPIITPMHADESINTAELRRQVDRQIENGVHALFCFGTNGEGYILDGREKQLVLETVIEQANGRVPVYAGTGCVSTRETIAQSRMARDAGADVLSIITPSFAANRSCTTTTVPWLKPWIFPSCCTISRHVQEMLLRPRRWHAFPGSKTSSVQRIPRETGII